MPKKIDPLTGVFSTFGAMSEMAKYGDIPERGDVFNDVIGDQTVDTVVGFDTQEWETGIQRDGTWIIVEQYDSREEAETGHNKWVKAITETPDMELSDVDIWGLDD